MSNKETVQLADTTKTRINPATEEAQATLSAAIDLLATEGGQATLSAAIDLLAKLTDTQPISAASLPLPTGASTYAAQTTLSAAIDLLAKLTDTQPISAASLPLPTGASTYAAQTDGTQITQIAPRIGLIGMGDLTVGVTEVEITFTGDTNQVRIRADASNTGTIFIGNTGVLADGTNDFVRLGPGDELTMSYNDSTAPLYAISDVAAQAINRGALL